MTVYEFYEAEIKRLTEQKSAREKAEAEAKAKKEQEFKEKIKMLFSSSLKTMFEWSMKVTGNMPDDAYRFMTQVINEELEEELDESELTILVEQNMITIRAFENDYSFSIEESYFNSDYMEFVEKTDSNIELVIYPDSPDCVHVEIWTNTIFDDSPEKKILREIIQELYDVKVVTDHLLLFFDIDIDKIFSFEKS